MEKRLHLLETFEAQGSDGAVHKVHAYEHMLRDPSVLDAPENWQSTGVTEFRLESGEPLQVARDGRMQGVRSGLTVTRG